MELKAQSSARRLAFGAAVLLAGGLAQAQIDAGTTDGTVTINAANPTAGNNYQTLADFVTAYNALPSINANWTVLIQSDLTVAANVGIYQTVAAGKTVTIKPDVSLNPTINFTQTADNVGSFSGHFLIGSTPTGVNVYDKLTNNLVIDGSNNGTDSRNLTIRNFGGTPTLGTNTRLINIVGNAQNVTIKNVNIENNSTATSAHTINLQGRGSNLVAAPSWYAPTTVTLENNLINNQVNIATGVSGSAAINFTFSTQTYVPISGDAIKNVIISKNTILSRQRGIFLNGAVDTTITSNVIDMNAGTTGLGLGAVQYNNAYAGAAGGPPYSLTISRNLIRRMRSVDAATNQSHQALNLSPGQSGTLGTAAVTIDNNIIGGFDIPSQTAGTGSVRVVSVSPLSSSTLNLRNNTLFLGPTLSSANLTGFSGVFINPANTLITTVQNNIFHSVAAFTTQPQLVRYNSSTSTTIINSNNNIFYHASTGSPIIGQLGAATFNTLSALQAAAPTLDANSQEIDTIGAGKATPAVIPAISAGAYVSTAIPVNLRWASKPVGLRGFNQVLATDIDGNTRSAVAGQSYPGAHELVSDPLPVSMSGFSIE